MEHSNSVRSSKISIGRASPVDPFPPGSGKTSSVDGVSCLDRFPKAVTPEAPGATSGQCSSGDGRGTHTPEAGGSTPSPGLVSTETSDTHGNTREFDPAAARLSRMSRKVRVTARTAQEHYQQSGFRYRVAFHTLTYRDGVEWEPRHITQYTKAFDSWARRRRIAYVLIWVLELTRAGRPHYHAVIFLPRGITPPKPDKQGWWRHGMSNVKWVRRPVAYISKYLSKGTDEHDLPFGARITGDRGVKGVVRVKRSYWIAPKWLREMTEEGDHLLRRGEWWVNQTMGICYRSPWTLDGFEVGLVRIKWIGWTEDDWCYLDELEDRNNAIASH